MEQRPLSPEEILELAKRCQTPKEVLLGQIAYSLAVLRERLTPVYVEPVKIPKGRRAS